MRRRDISAALLASATGGVLLPKAATAQTCTAPCYAQTAAETAAGVTPVNYNYPPLWADRYGTNSATLNSNGTVTWADMTGAIQSAIDVAAIQGGSFYASGDKYSGTTVCGQRVILQPTTYLTSSPIVIPSGVTLQGAGGYGPSPGKTYGTGTCIYYTGTYNGGIGSAAVQLGTSTSSISYFASVADLAITLTQPLTYGVQFLCTGNASAQNIWVFNPSTNVQSQNGFVIGFSSGTASVSSFFNTLINCYSQWCHNGFVFDYGGSYPTQTTFLQCSAVGLSPSDTTGCGVAFSQALDGEGSNFISCYFENFNTGVYFNGQPNITFVGTQFDTCVNDIRWSGSDQNVTFVGLRNWTQTGTPGTTCGVVNGSTPTTGNQIAEFSANNKPGTTTTSPSAWLPVTVPGASGSANYYIPLWQ
jgi:hypothetical protein